MDLGLGNLIELKTRLLAPGTTSETTYDDALTQMGRGVASMFDRYCNRKFARQAGAQEVCSADRRFWIVQRYPVETVSAVDLRLDVASDWVSQTVNDVVYNRDDTAGLLFFLAAQGNQLAQLRFTYTGGYWYDTTEDSTGAQPAGSTLVPYDLKEAWFLQCEEVWTKRDKLGLALTDARRGTQQLAALDLVPLVKQMLAPHRRWQLV